MMYSEDPDSELSQMYEHALRSHRVHNKKHGYQMHILRQDITGSYWNKLSYLLSLIITELAKPPGQRVEWFMWFDAGTVLLNPSIPLELFTPPSRFSRIHFLYTRTAGTSVFFLHTDLWSVELLMKAMSPQSFEMGSPLPLDEQALMKLLNQPEFSHGKLLQPQDWYAAAQMPGVDPDDLSVPTEKELAAPRMNFEGMPGNLLVRNPESTLGEDRWVHMDAWASRAQLERAKWEVALEDTGYERSTRDYWESVSQAILSLGRADRIAHNRGKELADGFRTAQRKLAEGLAGAADDVDSLKVLTAEMRKWFQEGAGFNENQN